MYYNIYNRVVYDIYNNMKYKIPHPKDMNLFTLLFILVVPFGGIIWFTYDIYKQSRITKENECKCQGLGPCQCNPVSNQ